MNFKQNRGSSDGKMYIYIVEGEKINRTAVERAVPGPIQLVAGELSTYIHTARARGSRFTIFILKTPPGGFYAAAGVFNGPHAVYTAQLSLSLVKSAALYAAPAFNTQIKHPSAHEKQKALAREECNKQNAKFCN